MLALRDSTKDLDRLKRRSDFLCARDSGLKWVSKTVILQATPSKTCHNREKSRVGFTVTKKLGNAVMRNRVKRRLRAAAATALPKVMRRGYDYVLIARHGVDQVAFDQLTNDIGWCVRRLHQKITEDAQS